MKIKQSQSKLLNKNQMPYDVSRHPKDHTLWGYRILVLMYNTLDHKQLQEKYASLHAVA